MHRAAGGVINRFVFSAVKIFGWILEPANLLLLGLLVGSSLLWVRRYAGLGRRLITVVASAAALVAVLPIGHAMITVLENRFPTLAAPDGRVDGIVVLGGAVNQHITVARGQIALSGAAERMTEFVALARRYPDAKLVFTGGSGSMTRQDIKETLVAEMFFAQAGLERERVLFEDQSRNTHENAIATLALVKPGADERWLLITSAIHMSRSVGCFRKAGWNVIPFPVDYTTDGQIGVSWQFSLTAGLGKLGTASYEWMALLIYWALGRTDGFFPGPTS